jgi:malonate transporter
MRKARLPLYRPPRGTHVDGTGHAQPTAPAKASQLAAIPPAPSTARRVAMAFRHALTRPVVLAPALGIVISLCGVPLDSIVATSLMLIGHAAAGVALFLTGLILSSQSFRLDAKVVSATAMADVVRPLAAAALVFLLPTTAEMARTAILLAAVPSGFFGILFAVSYRKDSATPGSMVLASTVVSAITLAIAIAVLFPR